MCRTLCPTQVNTMPLADRHPLLQRELYVLLGPCLLAHSQYPPDFTTWEEQFEVDEQAFYRWAPLLASSGRRAHSLVSQLGQPCTSHSFSVSQLPA